MFQADTRGWLAIGAFAQTIGVGIIIACRPEITDNTLFVSLSTFLVTNSWGAVVGFHFATSKGAGDANARADKAMDLARRTSDKEPGTVTVTPPAEVTVEAGKS